MSDDAPHLLVIDDDRRLLDLLQRYLTAQGYRVTTAPDAAAARRKLESMSFALAVVDIMMPGESGLDLTAALRSEWDMPVLLLTAMNDPEDRIAGLAQGADDYLAKPFEPRELVLRVQNVLRRVVTAPPNVEIVAFGPFSFDPARGDLYHGEARAHLTESETAMLAVLARHPGETVSRAKLCRDGAIEGGHRAVDVQITRLRRKIENDPKHPQYLRTVRGQGYKLSDR